MEIHHAVHHDKNAHKRAGVGEEVRHVLEEQKVGEVEQDIEQGRDQDGQPFGRRLYDTVKQHAEIHDIKYHECIEYKVV